jgi:hypothetical protein
MKIVWSVGKGIMLISALALYSESLAVGVVEVNS